MQVSLVNNSDFAKLTIRISMAVGCTQIFSSWLLMTQTTTVSVCEHTTVDENHQGVI